MKIYPGTLGVRYPNHSSFIKMAYREYLLHRFPYRIIYSIEAGLILIVAVVYQGRPTRLLAKPRAGRAGGLCLGCVGINKPGQSETACTCICSQNPYNRSDIENIGCF
jgi:hypothetical protein